MNTNRHATELYRHTHMLYAVMEPSQRTWKMSDGTAVFNYTQQAEAELGVRT